MSRIVKILSVCAAVVICLAIPVSAIWSKTVFSVNVEQKEKSMDVSVATDTFEGVGGLDFSICYNSDYLELDENSIKFKIEDGYMAVKDNEIRLLWDTIQEVKLPEVLATVSFNKLSEEATSNDVWITINEYYDNTIELKDLDYKIKTVEAGDTGSIAAWIIIPVAVILIAAAGYYFIGIKGYFRPMKGKH